MPTGVTQSRGFDGVRVIALESRRSVEMARLIESYGGVPRVAPSMREVPIERNQHALRFAAVLLGGQFDMMIFLTGVGTRALTKVVETRHRREEFVEALTKVAIVARGPKPIAALKELHVPVDVKVPEPNAWLELLQAIDPVRAGLRVAVQEYGTPNLALIQGLRDRSATVTPVPVYQWELPEDTGPLRQAIREIAERRADVVLFTTSVQVPHLIYDCSRDAVGKPAEGPRPHDGCLGRSHLQRGAVGPQRACRYGAKPPQDGRLGERGGRAQRRNSGR